MHPLISRALPVALAAAMLLSPPGGVVRAAETDAEQLPVPPVPPRIAQGEEYERCLAMISNDAAGARAFADAWDATGGGEGARHCSALATVANGGAAKGAAMLDALAASSKAPELARASVYAQAVQAWLIADDAARAFASATLALSLSPDDPDLLIDRSITTATMGRYLDSIDDLNRALTLAPKRADALVLRGAAWRHEGKLDRAVADVGHALSLEPQNPEALLERGIIRQRNGDAAGARADWNSAMAVAPGSAAADLAQQNLALLNAGPRTGN
jgi:Flp pilus assembly protein TadD